MISSWFERGLTGLKPCSLFPPEGLPAESGIPGIDEASGCCRTGSRFGFVLEPDGGSMFQGFAVRMTTDEGKSRIGG